jgi:hypothetical protein
VTRWLVANGQAGNLTGKVSGDFVRKDQLVKAIAHFPAHAAKHLGVMTKQKLDRSFHLFARHCLTLTLRITQD